MRKKMNMAEFGFPEKDELEVFLITPADAEQKVFRVYLNDDIVEPAYYNQVFLTLDTAGESDVVEFYINSNGGDAATAVQMRAHLSRTMTTTRAVIVGAAHSAASMIALSCDEVDVDDNANMLIHIYSGGAVGKRPDVVSQIKHETKYYKKVFGEVYQGFLKPKEMEQVWHGRDIWFTADKIRKRLDRRDRHFEENDFES